MKIFINYSDNKYRKQQKFALKMAKYLGGFDKEIAFNPSNIDAKFFQKYRNILEQKKGGGYWLWKPYFILKTLNDLNEGDYFLCIGAKIEEERTISYYHRMIELMNSNEASSASEAQKIARDEFMDIEFISLKD